MGTFRASFEGIGTMLCSPEMQAEMRRRAEKVKAAAEAMAPFDPGSKDGTHYKDSFTVESGVREGKTRRAYGRVTNDDPAAFYIEWGTKDTPRFRVLGRALDHARD